jgi:CysZ protein
MHSSIKQLVEFGRAKAQGLTQDFQNRLIPSLQSYFQAHDLVWKAGLARYMLWPGLAFLLLFNVIIQLIFSLLHYLEKPLTDTVLPFLEEYINLSTEYLNNGVEVFFWLLEYAIDSNRDAIFLSVFMVLGAPYLSFVSSRIQRYLNGEKQNTSTFWQELIRGIKIGVKTGLMELSAFAIIGLLGLIPLMDVLTPLLGFGVQAYFSGIVVVDYALEQRGLGVAKSSDFFKRFRMEIAGIGLGFTFLLLIPVVGWFIAPTYGLAASAILVKHALNNSAHAQ